MMDCDDLEQNEMNYVDININDNDVESIAITNYHQMIDVVLYDTKNDDEVDFDYMYRYYDNNTKNIITKPKIKLFTWIDHFCYLVVIPILLLFHYCNIELDLCQNTDMYVYDVSLLTSSYMCTTITIMNHIHNNTIQYNCFLLTSIGFFIISIYLYTISLYQIAPWMFLQYSWYNNTNQNNLSSSMKKSNKSNHNGGSCTALLSMMYQIIFTLPEIIFIIMIGCITMKYIEISIRIMLLGTISFSWFSIIIMGRQIFHQ